MDESQFKLLLGELKKIKKEVVVVKIDEDRLDFMRYLGDDMADMADEIKEKNGG
jgi:hypothetical protein